MGNQFEITKNEYFKSAGVNIMAFNDFYPAGHQSGVGIIMNDKRIATNGDLRFEPTPGQWQPVPKQLDRKVDREKNYIETRLSYPDKETHLRGFNPMIYPDLELEYTVNVSALEKGVRVVVKLGNRVPDSYKGKLFFNLELFPGILFGQPYLMDDKAGIFPTQPNGPVMQRESNYKNTLATKPLDDARADRDLLVPNIDEYNPIIADDLVSEPYAKGKEFTLCPQDEFKRFSVVSHSGTLQLFDGRMNHNNGWFVLSEEIDVDKLNIENSDTDRIDNNISNGVMVWDILPNVSENWHYKPVIQTSQIGYHVNQPKMAVIELGDDYKDYIDKEIKLLKMTKNGSKEILNKKGDFWGQFLRYNYLQFDFSNVKEEGMYEILFEGLSSAPFKISSDVYERGVWQPVLEYFLPVQMCHMKVQEKYRVWHGLCHSDDAIMAPDDINHFDGYEQEKENYTKYRAGDRVPGLNKGGWHDAGDFDLRIESQAGEVYNLALAIEEFDAYTDTTTIDQEKQITEIHQPDGKNDILEQIEHGLLSIIGGYKSLGRLYRGIIARSLRQYVLLGDPANMTPDARYVFTENNPMRELEVSGQLAAAARVIKEYNPVLAKDTLLAAEEIYENAGKIKKEDGSVIVPADLTYNSGDSEKRARVHGAIELYLTTKQSKYMGDLLSLSDYISANIQFVSMDIARIWQYIEDEIFKSKVYEAIKDLASKIKEDSKQTPYMIPYKPYLWGAGWNIEGHGVRAYFLNKTFPELFDTSIVFNSLDFVLGKHPGSNTSSFASGVGSKSATVAYGFNRADWSYIPGGVISGTALIQPDFPELLEFPYLWQQTEYVLAGGSTPYMLLVLAVKKLCEKDSI